MFCHRRSLWSSWTVGCLVLLTFHLSARESQCSLLPITTTPVLPPSTSDAAIKKTLSKLPEPIPIFNATIPFGNSGFSFNVKIKYYYKTGRIALTGSILMKINWGKVKIPFTNKTQEIKTDVTLVTSEREAKLVDGGKAIEFKWDMAGKSGLTGSTVLTVKKESGNRMSSVLVYDVYNRYFAIANSHLKGTATGKLNLDYALPSDARFGK